MRPPQDEISMRGKMTRDSSSCPSAPKPPPPPLQGNSGSVSVPMFVRAVVSQRRPKNSSVVLALAISALAFGAIGVGVWLGFGRPPVVELKSKNAHKPEAARVAGKWVGSEKQQNETSRRKEAIESQPQDFLANLRKAAEEEREAADQVEFVTMGEKQRVGDAEVTAMRARIGSLDLIDPANPDRTARSTKHYFQVWIQIRNMTKDKAIPFSGFEDMHTLTDKISDEQGNIYAYVARHASNDGADNGARSIKPGEVVHTLLAFEKPFDTADTVEINLSSQVVGGGPGRIKFRITRDRWATIYESTRPGQK